MQENNAKDNEGSLDESILMDAYTYGYAMLIESFKKKPLDIPSNYLSQSKFVLGFICDLFDRLRKPALEYLEVAVNNPEKYKVELNKRIDKQIGFTNKEWDMKVFEHYNNRRN
ncbi:hypothetical protein ACFLTH_09595 [Bacteroidota bacterium]